MPPSFSDQQLTIDDRGVGDNTLVGDRITRVTPGKSRLLETNLQVIVLYTLLFGVIASFLAGYLLSEDSTGWACFDFYKYHWPLVELFSATSWDKAVADYGGIP